MLDIRLKMVYDLVPRGILCDIGTDHAKLPVYAVKSGKCERALACDVNRGPLMSAKTLVTKEGLSDKIKLVLSNGFKDIEKADFESINCFVCAGMGGELIMNILSARFTDAYLVLQPQSAYYELVDYLKQNGYSIFKQCFCAQGTRRYNAMLTKYTGKSNISGYFTNADKSDAFYGFLQKESARIKSAVSCIENAKNPDIERMERLKLILSEIERENI